jgi:hypothetical protein
MATAPRPHRCAAALAIPLLIALACAACRSDGGSEVEDAGEGGAPGGDAAADATLEASESGGDGAETDADAGPVCNPAMQPATAECKTCMDSMVGDACAAPTQACDALQECAAIRTCAAACGTFQCIYDCIEQNPAGKQLYISWRGCVDTACHDPCHCPGCRLFNSSPCQECVQQNCQQACTGCDQNASCMAAMYCRYFDCVDPNAPSCWQDCTEQYTGSKDPFFALVGPEGCLSVKCGVECSKQ